MNQLTVKSLELVDDEKNVYVEGYASASVKDLDGETISEQALQKVASELTKEPYNKVFLDHAPLKSNADFEEKLPIGKIIEAKTREIEGKLKLWIKLVLNKAHPYFDVVYRSIKEGFLNAFSIGFHILQRKGNLITDLKILEVSLVGVPANPEAVVEEIYEKSFRDDIATKGVVPGHPFRYSKDNSGKWNKPTLRDFTDKTWDELSDEEKRRIAGHFAWAPKNPPERFTDLKLPHHDPKTHAVVWRGVVAAMAALFGARGGVDIPSEDRKKVYNHLASHYREFGNEPPEFKFLEEFTTEFFQEEVDLKSPTEEESTMTEEKIKELEAELEKLKKENEELKQKLRGYEEKEKAELISKITNVSDFSEEELKEKSLEELKTMHEVLSKAKIAKKAEKVPIVKDTDSEDEETRAKMLWEEFKKIPEVPEVR